MTDVEAKVRAGLAAFAAETEAVVLPPPVASLQLRAPVRVTRRSPRVKVAAALVGVVVLGAGVAGALGVLPGPVESKLREFREWGFGATEGATRMASTTLGDTCYEVWFAPLDSGGYCVYERVIRPRGDVDHGGSSGCSKEPKAPRSSTQFGALGYPETVGPTQAEAEREGNNAAVSSGQLPLGATAAVYAFDDGTTLTVAGETDGWFITAFPGVHEGVRITSITAVDARGHVLARS